MRMCRQSKRLDVALFELAGIIDSMDALHLATVGFNCFVETKFQQLDPGGIVSRKQSNLNAQHSMLYALLQIDKATPESEYGFDDESEETDGYEDATVFDKKLLEEELDYREFDDGSGEESDADEDEDYGLDQEKIISGSCTVTDLEGNGTTFEVAFEGEGSAIFATIPTSQRFASVHASVSAVCAAFTFTTAPARRAFSEMICADMCTRCIC